MPSIEEELLGINTTKPSNPLMQFARKPMCSVRLPSNGSWYDDDMITYNTIGEVDILPMLPTDELLMVSPDALLSGTSIIELFKSCVPSIKHPEKLYYPDVNTILFGIRCASNDEKFTQASFCPKCSEKKNKIITDKCFEIIKNENIDVDSMTDEDRINLRERANSEVETQIADMERDGVICLREQEQEIDQNYILGNIKMLPKEKFIEYNGLKIYVKPYTCAEKIKFVNAEIQQKNVIKYLQEQNKKKENVQHIDESETLEVANTTLEMVNVLGDHYMNILCSSVLKIEMPDGTFITNREQISEFIRNIDTKVSAKIKEATDELNSCGIMQKLEYTCECCGHTWEEPFYGFNQNDFFGQGS